MLQENILKEAHMWVKNSRKLWNIGQRIQHSKQRIPQSSMPNEHPSVLDIISLSVPLDNKEILHFAESFKAVWPWLIILTHFGCQPWFIRTTFLNNLLLLIFILGFNLHFPLFPASKLITTLYFIQTRSIIRFKHYSWTPSKQLKKKKKQLSTKWLINLESA